MMKKLSVSINGSRQMVFISLVPALVPTLEFREDSVQILSSRSEAVGPVLDTWLNRDDAGVAQLFESFGEKPVGEPRHGLGNVCESLES
jgi:hypothetical protein